MVEFFHRIIHVTYFEGTVQEVGLHFSSESIA